MADFTPAVDSELEYGFRWFEYHSSQRIQMFNVFIVVNAALISFAGVMAQTGKNNACILPGLLMIALAIGYWQIDVRSRALIQVGERLIVHGWKKYGLDQEPGLFPTSQVPGEVRYKHVIVATFVMLGLMGCAILVLGLS